MQTYVFSISLIHSFLNSIEKQNVNTLLRDAVSLLLENRPQNPILFMAEHFRNI